MIIPYIPSSSRERSWNNDDKPRRRRSVDLGTDNRAVSRCTSWQPSEPILATVALRDVVPNEC